MEIVFGLLVFVSFALGFLLGAALGNGGSRERELLAERLGYERCRRDHNLYKEESNGTD